MGADPIPLFPLHTVLFPQMPLPLHVFEERYRQMVRRCLDERTPFGVVLIREGEEAGAPALPEMAGTLARIYAVKPMAEGRVSIYTVGTERFRILRYLPDEQPYPMGIVEPLHDEPCNEGEAMSVADDVRRLFDRYFGALTDHAGIEAPEYELPDDPSELSFAIAAVLHSDVQERQRLLEMTDALARLTRERALLERENARLAEIARPTRVQARRITSESARSDFSRN